MTKHEIRNNIEYEMTNDETPGPIVSVIRNLSFGFVSYFDIRISDLLRPLAIITLGLFLFCAAAPRESAVEREARHEEIGRRRQGTILLLHKGAATLAAENSVAAIAAARPGLRPWNSTSAAPATALRC